jgi:hypothetical protein
MDVLPVWIRLPAPKREGDTVIPARCPFTGLSAAKLFNLSVPCAANNFKPAVRSVSVPSGADPEKKSPKNHRKGRFVRLIHLPSLLAYLDALADQQAQKEAA